MASKVYFNLLEYGNYNDNYFVEDYKQLINRIKQNSYESELNLGVINGNIVINNVKGNFLLFNCAVIEREETVNGTKVYIPDVYKIINRKFKRKDIWTITLVRDVFSANYDMIKQSDILVSRLSMDTTKFNPLLFIEEQFKLSEIKTRQIKLNEYENDSYGYMLIWKRDSLNGDIKWTSSQNDSQGQYDIEVQSLDEIECIGKYANINRNLTKYLPYEIFEHITLKELYNDCIIQVTENNHFWQWLDGSKGNTNTSFDNKGTFNLREIQDRLKEFKNIKVHEDEKYYNDYKDYVGKKVLCNDNGLIYEIYLDSEVTTEKKEDFTRSDIEYLLGVEDITGDIGDSRVVEINATIRTRQISKIVQQEYSFETIYANCIDQPYQLMFVPMMEDTIVSLNGSLIKLNKTKTEQVIFDLINKYSGENGSLIDAQIVPYSPIDNLFYSVGERLNIKSTQLVDNLDLGDNDHMLCYEVLYSTIKKQLNISLDVEDYKVSQKCKYFLTSPSGSNTYDFSLAKNGGLNGINAYLDIRPFASFVRIQPIYNNLYGSSFRDTRGLIYKEDNSLTMTSSAYETYKRSNINYINSFNETQDFKRSQQAITHETDWQNFAFDSGKRLIETGIDMASYFTGTAYVNQLLGQGSGSMGGTGAIGGAGVLGEAIEAGQLALNHNQDKKMLSNEIAYSRTQFNYSIGNMKAIPENITKVSGIYNTYNFVPYIQVFEPSELEKSIFKNYLNKFGVNLGLMIDISDKQFSYIQGTLIDYNGAITNEDYEVIQDTLKKGARLWGIEVETQ